MELKVKKLHPNARLPEYKTEGSVGMDFYLPNDIRIFAGETQLVGLGVAVAIPEGYEITIRGRSGLSTTSCYICKTGTIDWDYRGEIGVIIHNPNTVGEPLTLRKGERIAQGVIQRAYKANIVQAYSLDETKRGENGYGHTGR